MPRTDRKILIAAAVLEVALVFILWLVTRTNTPYRAAINTHSTQTVSEITLSADSLILTVGSSQNITAVVEPDDASSSTVTWTTSDSNIVTVDSSGTVTPVSPGTATLTATSGSITKQVAVTVKQEISVAKISLDTNDTTLQVGATEKLHASFSPENATNKVVTWISSNPSIADVDSNGVVTAKSVGKATITASSGGQSAQAIIRVKTSSPSSASSAKR